MKRLIKAEKKEINFEEVANVIYNGLDAEGIKNFVVKMTDKVQSNLTEEKNDYTFRIGAVDEERTNKFDHVYYFDEIVFPGVFNTDQLTSEIFDEIWENGYKVFNMAAKKLTEYCNLDGYFYYEIDGMDGTFTLFYYKPQFNQDEQVIDFLEESGKSSEWKRNRMGELKFIIDKSLDNNDKETFMSATEELKKLKEFFKESKRTSRLRRIAKR